MDEPKQEDKTLSHFGDLESQISNPPAFSRMEESTTPVTPVLCEAALFSLDSSVFPGIPKTNGFLCSNNRKGHEDHSFPSGFLITLNNNNNNHSSNGLGSLVPGLLF